jgi:hypothetical protein
VVMRTAPKFQFNLLAEDIAVSWITLVLLARIGKSMPKWHGTDGIGASVHRSAAEWQVVVAALKGREKRLG